MKKLRKVQKDAILEGLRGMRTNLVERLKALDDEIKEAEKYELIEEENKSNG